ncbi:MAG: ATP-binding cassette domain-containing protein [Opitutaceae bacterium]|nr:ATP-binding cassette domain-containing protein [Opitutaceae bacterium]
MSERRIQSSTTPPVSRGVASAPHLELRGLGLKRGDRWLVRGLNLAVPRGAFVAVVGPSGVGKSSFLSAVAGLLEPTEGEVIVRCHQGCDHRPLELQHCTGIVFQQNLLTPNATVLTNTLAGRLGRRSAWRTLFGFPREDRQAAYRILCDLGLGAQVHRWSCQTSGGEQQRTAIARALLQEPDLYLADEPVSALDAYLTGRVLGLLRQEAREHGRTVLCVLHNAELVERFADLALSFDPGDPANWKVREVRR